MEQRRRVREQAPGIAQAIHWTRIDDVGTRDDVTLISINRPCTRRAEPVVTSRRSPVAVVMCCDNCAPELVEAERSVPGPGEGGGSPGHELPPRAAARPLAALRRRRSPSPWPPQGAAAAPFDNARGGDTERAVDASGGPHDPQACQESRAGAQSVRALPSHNPRCPTSSTLWRRDTADGALSDDRRGYPDVSWRGSHRPQQTRSRVFTNAGWAPMPGDLIDAAERGVGNVYHELHLATRLP